MWEEPDEEEEDEGDDRDEEEEDVDEDDDSLSNDSITYNSTPLQDLMDNPTPLSKSHRYYVLFVDPESFIYYRKDLARDDYIVFEPFVDEQVKKRFY